MKNKHIIVGITGGIAAYKAAILVRLLIKSGATVQVLMTDIAKKFVTPLTMATLSKRPVLTEFFNPENGEWNSHVDLGLSADAFVIAPATANTMAKAASGIADNLLLTTYLSSRCPVFWAPTMDLDMYKHPATQESMHVLTKHGDKLIEPDTGELASGLSGEGRMAEPERIFETLNTFFSVHTELSGKNVLITAGPTYEAIDPVRFIGNRSSGKMGYALAEAAAQRGAEVTLISGPVALTAKHSGIHVVDVETAEEMYHETTKQFERSDVVIFAAAVADYKPAVVAENKLKKTDNQKTMTLEPTIDIAGSLAAKKKEGILTVGFALETDNEMVNAKRKIEKKNFDFIVLNSLKDKGAGFSHDTNKVTIVDRNNKIQEFELKSKLQVAEDILNKISEYYT
ncbi:MAG: bifunctional phosphopantothenoylcysteine decarboxylase/phosphopantothenate--cysteine ligase CoaBC [Bacteroidota bacterium]|nr:bifunctional phosphopantothenoylcysteine decarboxylase/phosphopantothenate--cysteine ligase CoaBC [Bacteroidota bacterium]